MASGFRWTTVIEIAAGIVLAGFVIGVLMRA